MGTIFSAYDIRGRAGQSLTIEYAWTVGKAFSEWLSEDGDIVVANGEGADESLRHAIVEGLLLQGRSVIDAGQSDQQNVIDTIRERQASGGLVITHDALQDIEIITLLDARGVVVTGDRGLTEIEQLIEAGNFLPAAEKGKVTS